MPKPAPTYYTSPLSAYVAMCLPGDFHYLDGDEVLFRHSALPIVYARETGVLRVIESKHPGEELRRSQREVLPVIAACLALAVAHRVVADGSGVFVVEGRAPYADGATVARVRPRGAPAAGLQTDRRAQIAVGDLNTFLRCRR